MKALGAIHPDCGYVPFTGRWHIPGCDPIAHTMLCLDVNAIIDPPIYRAIADDHELCAMLPCADCRR